MAMKADDSATAALCDECHVELDNGKSMTKEERRAEMDRCIVLTVIQLARLGLITVKGVRAA